MEMTLFEMSCTTKIVARCHWSLRVSVTYNRNVHIMLKGRDGVSSLAWILYTVHITQIKNWHYVTLYNL